MSSQPPSPSDPHAVSVSDEMTEVFAPGPTPKSVFPTSPHALPVGARIGEFEVHRLIGEGGFGIVYLCYDEALVRYVALKEYMPSSLATRRNDTQAIVVKSDRHSETFEAGLKSFINEARLLAQFDHPSLLKVYRFWQANGTAYMTMPYYEGPTLKQALTALSGPPDEALLRSWLLPMLDALEEIHRASCYHRDIAPDNILLTSSGPLLLDFGAARRVIGDMTQALTVVLKPGFAPIEQYGDAATMSQGAWTDLYALASVVYFAITGRPPMSAVDRVMDDRLEPLSHRVAGRYSHALLATVDTALSLRPQDRPQSVAAFRAMLSATSGEQTADLHLWGDDDAPTELDAATVPGVLGNSPYNEPRTVPTGRKNNESPAPAQTWTTPAENVALPHTAVAPVPATTPAVDAMPLPERTMVAMRKRPEVEAVPPTAAFAPGPQEVAKPTVLTGTVLPDDQPRTPFVPRSPPAVTGMGSGAGLAPLSGAAAVQDKPHKVGIPAPLPPRPVVAERTAMPSLLPAAAVPQAASPVAVEKQSASNSVLAGNNKQRVNWALWLSLGAFVLAAAAAIWTFTRSDADAASSAPEAPSMPNTAPGPSATGESPTPAPAAQVTPTPPLASPAEPVVVQSPAPAPAPVATKAVDPVATERKAAVTSKPPPTSSVVRPADNGDTNPVSAAPTGTPPIRLGNPATPRAEADAPIVLTRPSATTAAPAKVDVAPPTPPVAATPSAGPRSIARCADIRQRAGLEDLTPEERQFLRTQCR